MRENEEILTIPEVAAELRCSRAHAYKVVNGKVAGVSTLPSIAMGRRKLVRRASLERWKRANEKGCDSAMMSAPLEIDAVGRIEEKRYA